jgi:hypothetical protein
MKYTYILLSILYMILSCASAQKPTIIQEVITPVQTGTINNISEISYQLVIQHIHIGKGENDLEDQDIQTENDILDVISASETRVKADIIQSLKSSPDNTLNTWDEDITQIAKTLNQGNFLLTLL